MRTCVCVPSLLNLDPKCEVDHLQLSWGSIKLIVLTNSIKARSFSVVSVIRRKSTNGLNFSV